MCFTGCGSGRTAVECANNPCSSSTCPGHPTAFCEIETCGECLAKYYDTSLVEVTETCGKIWECSITYIIVTSK